MNRRLIAVLASLALAGCEEEVVRRGSDLPPEGTTESGIALESQAALVVPREYRDRDFLSSERNRDPFQPYPDLFVSRIAASEIVQREVLMGNTAIADMRLIAIISGVSNPSAMLVDTDGTGYTVRRGDYLGAGESVQVGDEDSMAVTLNWRVDRIRPGELVLALQNTALPDQPPRLRVLHLHEETMESSVSAGAAPGSYRR